MGDILNNSDKAILVRRTKNSPNSEAARLGRRINVEKHDNFCQDICVRRNNDENFKNTVLNNLWENRRDKGYGYRTDIYAYIFDIYSTYLDDGGIVEADFNELDFPLWQQLQRTKQRKPIPSWLNLKTERDARRASETPEEREINDKKRLLWRETARQVRSLPKLNP